ncbi:TonB-dependent receptor [Uliginosibacterium sediminicola]|uniref:TonB-dependent receptor n=1 Tax=Uliginosibacterium sediminicola TaxID=2024550 RepID=A0ABU9YVJ4_9RHOO
MNTAATTASPSFPQRPGLRPIAQAVSVALCSLALCSISPTALAQASSAAQAGSARQQYNIPAGPLAAALRSLASSANVLLSFTAEQTQAKTTAGIKGQYSVQDALAALLTDTGLQAVPIEQGGFVLRPLPAGLSSQAKPAKDLALPAVTVTGHAPLANDTPDSYAGGQVARGARLGILGNVDIMDAPFNVTAYTAQTIADQQSTTVGDVLRNDPSVRFTTSDGHNSENMTIRGFDINSSELAFNGLYGLMPGTHVPTEFLERVEVFKGPAAMLSGMAPSGAVGGVINLVPKRATDAPLTRLTSSYISSSRLGLAADISRRFGEEKRLGVRFNGSANNGKTELEGQKKDENFSTVAVDYRGDHWKLEFDAYDVKQDQSNGSPLMVYFGTLGHVLKAPDASKNALQGTYAKQRTEGAMLRGEIDLNRQLSAYASIGQARYNYEGYINGTRTIVLADDGRSTGTTYNQAGYTRSISAETGLRGNFATGSVAHRVVASYSSLQTTSGAASVATSANYTTNLYNPNSNPVLAGAHGAVVRSADNAYTGLALSDTLSMLDDELLLTLGARNQHVRQKMASPRAYDETAITPLAGVVFKPWGPDVSLYANYIEGLSPGVTVGTTYANSGETLAPYKTRQAETGVKWAVGDFTNTVSLFRILKPSTVSISNGSALPTLALDGEQVNRGVEWNIFGKLSTQTRILGGAAYTQGKQVRAATASNNGKKAPGVPEWTANLGGEWDTPYLSGLTLDTRLIYTDSQYLDAANTLQIPSWTRWDLGARYSTRIAGKAVVLRANIENVTDRNYWSGRFNEGYATLGAPRTYKLSATVDF